MNSPDDLSAYYAALLEGSYDCVDRIVLNAYFPLAQKGGGFRTWWRQLYGNDAKLDNTHLQEMAGTFARRLKAWCAKEQVPLVPCEAGERKHEVAEAYLPKDPKFRGVFLVLSAKVPAPVWEVQRNAQGQITNLRHKPRWPFVKCYYFHLIDPEWGHVTVRICGHPPFGAQVILNGHEWVERRAWRRKVQVVKAGNCFVEGSDFKRLESVARGLGQAGAIGQLEKVCERWLYSSVLCFALTRAEQEQSRFRYCYSVFQLELSRNLLFRSGRTLDEVYQKLLDRTRQPLGLESLKTIFGTRCRPPARTLKRGRREPEVAKEVQSVRYDLTVFKVRWGKLVLKIYDKNGQVLRVEVVAHNAKELKAGKLLEKLPELLERMEGILVRFLNTVQVAHVSFLDQGAFEAWAEPSVHGTRRLAGIDLNKARIRHVVGAVVALSTEPQDFTLGQLTKQVRERSGWKEADYNERRAAYDLAKLRGKGLVERPKGTRRYRSEPPGVRTMCAYVVLREKVLKPLMAGAAPRHENPAPKVLSPLDEPLPGPPKGHGTHVRDARTGRKKLKYNDNLLVRGSA